MDYEEKLKEVIRRCKKIRECYPKIVISMESCTLLSDQNASDYRFDKMRICKAVVLHHGDDFCVAPISFNLTFPDSDVIGFFWLNYQVEDENFDLKDFFDDDDVKELLLNHLLTNIDMDRVHRDYQELIEGDFVCPDCQMRGEKV